MVRKFHNEDARVEPMVTVTPEENWILHTIRHMDVNIFTAGETAGKQSHGHGHSGASRNREGND